MLRKAQRKEAKRVCMQHHLSIIRAIIKYRIRLITEILSKCKTLNRKHFTIIRNKIVYELQVSNKSNQLYHNYRK